MGELMSYAPQTLLDARAYILAHTNLSPVQVGIVGDSNHTYGYHLGKDRLPASDYSRVTPRDRAGLSNAASALDIGDFGDLWRLTEFLVAEARNGRLPDVREILGPLRDGRAYRWDHLDGWKAVRQAKGDSHEWHIHISYYRDSEHRDKTDVFRRFFEGDGGSRGGLEDDMHQNEIVKHTDKNVAYHLRNTLRGVRRLEEGQAVIRAQLESLVGRDVTEAVQAAVAPILQQLDGIRQLVEDADEQDARQIVDEIARRLGEGG